MIKRTTILILLYLSSFYNGFGQVIPYCGTGDYEDILSQDTVYYSQIRNQEKRYRSYIKNPIFQSRNNEVLLPVVFHIIHNNGPENLSDTQVLQELEYLNQAFSNEGPYQSVEGIDTRIRFCLAQRDDSGNEITGILRYETPYTDMSIFAGYEFVKSRKIDSTQYINIQIVKEACLGNDCYPAGFSGEYRIVLEARTLDESPENASVLIHEMGHYLGLKHTFHGGCENDDCLADGDRVCDTPPDNRTFDGCDNTSNSCYTDENDLSNENPFRPTNLGGIGDQQDHQTNFMDYNFRFCRNRFSQGQTDRMHFFIEHKYTSLLDSKGCLPPCESEVISNFVLPDSIPIGTELTINNTSTNGDHYQWSINENPNSTADNLTFIFLEEGVIQVQLEAYTNDTLCKSNTLIKEIIVYCPVEACFDYQINGQYLKWMDCSINTTDVLWTIIDTGNDIIYTSSLSEDSVYVNNIDFVKICLVATGEFCEDTLCEFITITSDGSEVCGNEEDDDGDGLIDLFDPDCSCEDGAYQAICSPDCEIIPDSFPDVKMKMKWESDIMNVEFGFTISRNVVGDVNNDGIVEIINGYSRGGTGNSKNYIAHLSGINGKIIDTIRIFPEYNLFEMSIAPALARVGNDIYTYIYERGQLVCYNSSGSEVFRSSHPSVYNKPAVADFNADGIPEVYCGNVIFNGISGDILFVGRDIDCFENGRCRVFEPVAADVVGNDNIPELITGKHVYQIEITNLTDTIGNTATVVDAPIGIEEGRCAVSDMNGDGLLDIIVVEQNYSPQLITGALTIWDPRTATSLTNVSNPPIDDFNFGGGMPFVGDIDGDCIPEIGVVYEELLRMFKYTDGAGLEMFYDITTTDDSGFTGVTMFDFNQDGKQELIYRDETSLRIFEGATGATIDSFPLFSGTGSEYPIIADVDNDGQAEIIVSGSRTSQDEVRMYCFESATTPWPPARSVWNQYAYNPTQVNDDLTIPRYQQNAAQPLQGTENCTRETCNTPYNNFMIQATYRTQEGCYVWPELQRDLTISAESRCVGDSLEICFYTSSTDTTIINQGVTINCYPPPWDEGNGVGIQSIDEVIVTNDTTCIMMPMLDIDSLLIVINDDNGVYPNDFPITDIQECDYTNNEFVLQIGGPDFSIDIVDYECNPDSLIFYIATDNIGQDTDISCIDGGCYFISPYTAGVDPQENLLEVTTWCFDYDTTTMMYNYQDTFRVVIPHPNGQSTMWWTINEGGFGPGVLSSDITDIYECNYTNNTDSISFDISEKVLDLGPDITKCSTEVFTLNAGLGFESYLWNDLTTDFTYSAIEEGIHYVEAIDQCGRIYRDTIIVTIDESQSISLGEDIILCYQQDTTLSVSGNFDKINWHPAEFVDCDTCKSTLLVADTSITLIAQGTMDNCVSYDTIKITRLIPEMYTTQSTYCIGDTIDFGDQEIYESGVYSYLAIDCSVLNILEAEFNPIDTTFQEVPICQGDSIQIENTWYFGGESVEVVESSSEGCDSIINFTIEVVDILSDEETISFCEGDSMLLHNQWVSESGEYPELFQTQSGCDSVFTYIVTTVPSSSATVERQICEGDSVIIESEIFITEGSFEIIAQATNGCDSVITLNLEILAHTTGSSDMEFCMGDSLFIDDQWIYESGDFEIILQNNAGCDSILTVSVTEVPMEVVTDSLFACSGDSILLSGNYYFDNQVVSDTIWDSACPMLRNTTLAFVDQLNTEESIVICPGDTISFGSIQIFESGMYPFTSISESGCDSVHTITATTLETLFTLPADTLLEDDSFYEYMLDIDTSVWSVSWTSDDIDIDCENCLFQSWNISESTHITLDIFSDDGCEVSHNFQISVTESDEIVYPNIFTPNDDGINDNWFIDMTKFPVNALQIYDRWGNKIFAQKNVDMISWDGRTNNQHVSPGVYIFMLEYNNLEGTQELIFGDITVLR